MSVGFLTSSRRPALSFVLPFVAVALIGCGDGGLTAQDVPGDDTQLSQDAVNDDGVVVRAGRIEMLIYNVAGLPMEISEVNPIVNTAFIAPKLNDYELVLVQEDFWYHADLDAGTSHPYKSEPMWPVPDWDKMGDGLNTFSYTPFEPLTRVAWGVCNGYLDSGSDCLTNKGFTWTRHELAPDIFVDVYNLHMDASGNQPDIEARQAQAVQLAAFIESNSAGNAILLGGDTNLKVTREQDMATLADFLTATGLTDACRSLGCTDERIDRIMFRSSETLEITPVQWSLPPEFVDADGNPLSDHVPVLVLFDWTDLTTQE